MDIWLWIGFIVFILFVITIDLGIFHRQPHVLKTKEYLSWSLFWIVLSLLFNILVFFIYRANFLEINKLQTTGGEAALQFFTAYLVEKSLSLDNIFVIALVFAYFKVPLMHQHRVLFWGILGVIVLRFIMIMMGVALIHEFSWMVYIFGAFLIFTAVKMLVIRQETLDPKKNILIRLAYKWKLVTEEFHGQHFFVKIQGKWMMTPLFLSLIIVESSDILFAVDSIPAVIAITADPFIVYTSNIFAVLGLRSLYFLLADMLERFVYVKLSLVFTLAFIGTKMLLSYYYPMPTMLSLSIILGILAVGILASLVAPPDGKKIDLATLTIKQIKRVITLTVGITVLLIGLAMLVLPGPAFIVIPIGLAILAREFLWAKKLLQKAKDLIKRNSDSSRE